MTPENLEHFEPLWLEKVQIFVDQLAPNSCQAAQLKWTTAKNVSHYGNQNILHVSLRLEFMLIPWL